MKEKKSLGHGKMQMSIAGDTGNKKQKKQTPEE